MALKRVVILVILAISTTIEAGEYAPPGPQGPMPPPCNRPIFCNDKENGGFYSNPNNCTKFYRCVDQGLRYLSVVMFECGPGTYFDPSIDVCNYPEATLSYNPNLECADCY